MIEKLFYSIIEIRKYCSRETEKTVTSAVNYEKIVAFFEKRDISKKKC